MAITLDLDIYPEYYDAFMALLHRHEDQGRPVVVTIGDHYFLLDVKVPVAKPKKWWWSR